jgi:hypothetical protein
MPTPSALANASDANMFLDSDTLSVTDQNDQKEQQEAANMITGYLYGRVPVAAINAWTANLGAVPPIIRGIAGRLVAAFRYRAKYSESENEVSPYASKLYNEAIAMLNAIVRGDLIIPELVDAGQDVSDVHITEAYFYPNDSSGLDPIFNVERTF